MWKVFPGSSIVSISSCRMHILERLRASYVISCPSSAIYKWLKNPANPVDAYWTLFLEILQNVPGLIMERCALANLMI